MAGTGRRTTDLVEVGRAVVQSARNNAWQRAQRNAHVGNGSPVYERHRGARVQRASDFVPGMIVKMFDDAKDCVGEGVVTTLQTGDLLLGERMHPLDIGICVTIVYKPSTFVREVFKENLGDCVRCTIRWRRNLIGRTGIMYREENIAEVARVYEFSEDADATTTPVEQPTTASGRLPRSTGEGPSVVDSNDSPIPGFECPMQDGLVPTEPRRPYITTQRVAAERRGLRIVGEDRSKKVTLRSVQCAMNRSKCARKCLSKIGELVILNHRYAAWKSPSYRERKKWILGMLREAMVQAPESGGRATFRTKIEGKNCCNRCYADASGYSQRQLLNLKGSIRTHNSSSGTHGNSGRSREQSSVAACRAALDNFFRECGCVQPHRHAKRLSDGQYVPLVLLPMNTRREDVLLHVNREITTNYGSEKVSKARLDRMWAGEFTHVTIPPNSRFSKCQICWEYKECMDAMRGEWQRTRIRESYERHIAIQIEERRDYWEAKRTAVANPDAMLCLIVDGMDQNTTMVPKFRQSVKGIEGRYVKTHLCGVLVHGLALYCHVWVDAHHKHDSNQVVTSIVKVLDDVRSRRGTLPPTLRIQADNCGRENKNKYMFAFCATLVALGHFREVQLSFLIVGHTHEDIDQRFSVISNVLKKQDIASLKQMLAQVESGARNRDATFTTAELLENIWDWSGFITPHLHVGGGAWVGTRAPHHFRFYVQNNEPRVQYKIYCKDPWGPAEGYSALRSVPAARAKPSLAVVSEVDPREVSSLDEFIRHKERLIARGIHVTNNMEAIYETQSLQNYLREFPNRDRGVAATLPFWPDAVQHPARPKLPRQGGHTAVNTDGSEGATPSGPLENDPIPHLPDVEPRGYFGPSSSAPRTMNVARRGGRPPATTPIVAAATVLMGLNLGEVTNRNGEAFPAFDPHKDIAVGQFVAVCSPEEERIAGAIFYVGKVRRLERAATPDGEMKVMWYWPKMPRGAMDATGEWHHRYANWESRCWEPSKEDDDYILVSTAMTAWTNPVSRSTLQCTVHGWRTEKEIRIPEGEVYHINLHLRAQTERQARGRE